LVPKDSNGLSDPCVKVSGGTKKFSHTTAVIKKTVNPKWNEIMSIDCKTSDTINVSVFDHHKIGKDEFEGSVTINVKEHYIKQIQQNTNNLVITYPLGADPQFPNAQIGGSISFKTFFEKKNTNTTS